MPSCSEEQLAHVRVVVLPGVDEQRLDLRAAGVGAISGAIFMKFGRAPTTLMIFTGDLALARQSRVSVCPRGAGATAADQSAICEWSLIA